MLKTHEGKCCDAVVRHLEERRGVSRANVRRHDNDPNQEARVELTFTIGDQMFAMEHTAIEPFEGFLEQNNSPMHTLRDIEPALLACLPNDSDFRIYIAVRPFEGAAKSEIAVIKARLVEWLCATGAASPITRFGQHSGAQPTRPPGLAFDVTLQRIERSMSERRVDVFTLVANTEERRVQRIKRACSEKRDKLDWWKDARGARSVLVLENNDIQISDVGLIADALAIAEGELGTVADEVWLIGTHTDGQWSIAELRIDAVRYPDLQGDGPMHKLFDPSGLRDLTVDLASERDFHA